MNINRRSFLLATGAAAIATPALLAATPALAAKPRWFTGLVAGTGAGGYDTVAYFTEGKAVPGSKKYVAEYDGIKWQFASAANRDKFVADPVAFAPKYGGYCSYAVAKGGTAKGDPEAWSVVDNKLYLNFNKTVRGIWSQDIPGNIARAEANWPRVLEA